MKRGILVAILVIAIFVIFLVLASGFVYLQLSREPFVPENTILKIDFSGDIRDHEDTPVSKSLTISDLFYHLQRAKIDDRIKGLLLKISYVGTGFSKVADIGEMLEDFRRSGKKAFAFFESGGLKDYYLASFADKVYAFKGGDLFLRGLASEAVFLKDTLGKLGIKAEMLQIGEYKTAMNMFTEDGLTPAHRESLQTLLDDIYAATLDGIARNRRLDRRAVETLIEESPLDNRAYIDGGLVDDELYEDELLKGDLKSLKIIDFHTYAETTDPKPFRGPRKIAVIFAGGEIHLGKSGDRSFTGDRVLGATTLSNQLSQVRKSGSVKAVVLRIDSPGGSAVASEIIRREVELLQKSKPLVVSMSDYAASGGYWLSLSGSEILAQPQTITGSIGVVGGKFVMRDLYDTIGLKKEILRTSRYADMFSDYRTFTPDEKEKLARMMRKFYRSFLKIVSEHRDIPPEETARIAQGRVWSGRSALKLRLVDRFGGLASAVILARELAEIPDDERVGLQIYPKKKSFLELIVEAFGMGSRAGDPIVQFQERIRSYGRFFPAFILPYRLQIH